MTRINLIPPTLLSNQHLVAEHKEILQLNGQFKKSLNSKKGIQIPKGKFTLNKGHVKFFYNKGKYLENRFNLIKIELKNRGYSSYSEFDNYLYVQQNMYNDWIPDKEDYNIIVERLLDKLENKKEYYKYKNENFNIEIFKNKIKELMKVISID